MKLIELKPGETFDAGVAKMLVLEHFENELTLVISENIIGHRPFNLFPLSYDEPEGFNLNDWRTSTIRKDLNENFLSALEVAGKIDIDRIVTTKWDLSDHKSTTGYGTSKEKIGLLSQNQFKKYTEQGLLEFDDWWWLITPNAGNSYLARFVNTDGSLSDHYAYNGNRGVRPVFCLESGVELAPTESKILEGLTTRQLVAELLRRADRNELPKGAKK